MDKLKSLEKKLNDMIDTETEKGCAEEDADLVSACCDALLRMDGEEKYRLTSHEYNGAVAELSAKVCAKKFTRKRLTAVLVAAILMLIVTASVASGYSPKKFDVLNYDDHDAVVFHNSRKNKPVGKLTAEYIPEGFEQVKDESSAYYALKEYHCGDKIIILKKSIASGVMTVDNEDGEMYTKVIDGTEYNISGGENGSAYNIFWVKGGIVFDVFGAHDLDELLKTAKSMK